MSPVSEISAAQQNDSRQEPRVLETLKRYWGYDSLRPLQHEAINAALSRQDSLLVLPTGGGKSLCYQLPAAIATGLTIVVSPLISLMKDQVDGLQLNGYPAGCLHSGISPEDASTLRSQVSAGAMRLLYVAPERLLQSSFLSWLARIADAGQLEAFAIDEAHCISQWGHDFRPEYRRLAELRDIFPRVPFHAFTATATPRVREDIVHQLRLKNARVLVGTFDRPNLTYRIVQRTDLVTQVARVLRKHDDQGCIVYCISRKDTESLAADLTSLKIKASAYHAGLDPRKRAKVQDDFINERVNVVVATVAFGMGIDRSDVRCVIHAAMPKTVEHYQQETGRAGRDGLPSECVLFTSPQDGLRWRKLMERSAAESSADAESIAEGLRIQHELLQEMQNLASSATCRHRALTEYFGQEYQPPSNIQGPGCGACDVCLGNMVAVPGSTTIAQKILSCVYRMGQNSGAAMVADVLRGSRNARVLERGFDKLSTFALLASIPKEVLTTYIQQLVQQRLLAVAPGEFPVISLTSASREVLTGKQEVTLYQPRGEEVSKGQTTPIRASNAPALSSEEQALFDSLRTLRRALAEERNVPPYVIFSDATLEELARVRPTTLESMSTIKGVGRIKLADLGEKFSSHVAQYCSQHNLSTDLTTSPIDTAKMASVEVEPRDKFKRVPPRAATLFEQKLPIAQVAAQLERSPSTICEYLTAWIEQTKTNDISPWVNKATEARVRLAIEKVGAKTLRPLFEELGGQVTYEQIKLVIALMRAEALS
ncbi:MAG: DNA helicase RecQ [Phycisphaerales bacterium]